MPALRTAPVVVLSTFCDSVLELSTTQYSDCLGALGPTLCRYEDFFRVLLRLGCASRVAGSPWFHQSFLLSSFLVHSCCVQA